MVSLGKFKAQRCLKIIFLALGRSNDGHLMRACFTRAVNGASMLEHYFL